MGNVIGGFAMLLICIVFWMQRDYSSDYGGIFPDAVLVALAALSLILVARGLLWRKDSGWDWTGQLEIKGLTRAIVLLVAWVASLPILGYLVGGVIFFTLMAVLMRTTRPTWKNVLLDLGVAIVVVGAFYLAFTEVLYVKLPELSL